MRIKRNPCRHCGKMPTVSREKAGTLNSHYTEITIYCRCKRGSGVSSSNIEESNQAWNKLNPAGSVGFPFIVGERVKIIGDGSIIAFGYNSTIIRKVTMIRKSDNGVSGFVIQADAGEPCPHCKRLFDTSTLIMDSAKFEKA